MATVSPIVAMPVEGVPAPCFEGSEKRLEVDFATSYPGQLGLRALSRPQLDTLLALACCEIVSERKHADFDAYVLSESSLFVYPTKLVLKTCGSTALLNTVPKLLEYSAQLALRLKRCKYSRASFMFPGDQPKPYGTFTDEVSSLEKSLGPLATGGAAYVLGNAARSLQWHVYIVDAEKQTPLHSDARTTIEVCMADMDPQCAAKFLNPGNTRKARAATESSGIQALLPDTHIDDFLFEPCGYSMNGVENAAFSTVHVTPEPECSYASFELSGYSADPCAVLAGIVPLFKPARLCMSVSADCVEDLFPLLQTKPSGPTGYACDGQTLQSFPGGGGVLFQYLYFVGDAGLTDSAAIADDRLVVTTPPLPEPVKTTAPSSPAEVKHPQPKRQRTDVEPLIPNFGGLPASHPALPVLSAHNCSPLVSASEASVDKYARALIDKMAHNEAFYLFDLGVVLRRFNAWKKCLPRVEPFYAVKCNGDPALLQLLASLGAGFDCASPIEMDSVLALGIAPERIVYANACKLNRHLEHAKAKNVKWTTFDNADELRKVAVSFPGAELILRLRADDPAARCPLGDKYGAEEHEVEGLMRCAQDLGLNVVGISFHVGSGATDPASFTRAVTVARSAFDLAETLGMRMTVLDIGGGFSGGAESNDDGVTLEAVAASINTALEEHFPAEQGVRIISEPGRYFAEAAATFVGSIFGRRVRTDLQGKADTHAYWISDGLYGSFNCLLYDHATVVARPLQGPRPALAAAPHNSSTVFGPTCDGLDTVLRGTPLPEMEVGDWLVFPNMGAYTTCAGSKFNGFDVQDIKVHYVYSEKP